MRGVTRSLRIVQRQLIAVLLDHIQGLANSDHLPFLKRSLLDKSRHPCEDVHRIRRLYPANEFVFRRDIHQ
ncbi:hypothetical protein D3C72_822280 [compost metagenome]